MPKAGKSDSETYPDVIINFDRFRRRCDYRWKDEKKQACGHYGMEASKPCKADSCPEVLWIVENITIEPEKRSFYTV